MEPIKPQRKKPGRKPTVSHYKTTSVALPPEQLEWARTQPGGIAALVRECVETKYQKREPEG